MRFRWSVALLVLGALLAGLGVTVGYGLMREYGDTAPPRWSEAVSALTEWSFVLLPAFAVLAAAALLGRHSRAVVSGVLVCLVGTAVAAPAAGVVALDAKYASFPDVPHCTAGFTSGPAVPVTRAAQVAYDGLEHPAPFTGGGSSGVAGCSSGLALRDGDDPAAHYRRTLPADGWTVERDTERLLRARRDGQAFELRVRPAGTSVWIGPAGP